MCFLFYCLVCGINQLNEESLICKVGPYSITNDSLLALRNGQKLSDELVDAALYVVTKGNEVSLFLLVVNLLGFEIVSWLD